MFTRYYRPPEIILGLKDYDEKADIWSIGCLLYEVLQKTKENQEKINHLFVGDSCYPHSPLESSDDDENEDNKIEISSNDQLIKIFETLGVT